MICSPIFFIQDRVGLRDGGPTGVSLELFRDRFGSGVEYKSVKIQGRDRLDYLSGERLKLGIGISSSEQWRLACRIAQGRLAAVLGTLRRPRVDDCVAASELIL